MEFKIHTHTRTNIIIIIVYISVYHNDNVAEVSSYDGFIILLLL